MAAPTPVLIHVFDLGPYVEAQRRYQCDKVSVAVVDQLTDPKTYTVEVKRADTYGQIIPGNALVDKSFGTDFKAAIAYYDQMILQLQQGDVIRNV